jgi:nitroreductase
VPILKNEVVEMEISEAIFSRRSIRKYKNIPIEREKLDKILEAGIWAPSARNTQPWQFIVVTDLLMKKKLEEAASFQEFVGSSACVIIVCASEATRHYKTDIGLAMENICLQATALGIGSCIVGHFDPEKVRTLFKIPKHIKILYLITLGYPDEYPTSHRKSRDDIVHYEQW